MTVCRVGISACLAGATVRYDSGQKLECSLVEELERRDVELVKVCPETECGLPVPRDPMDLFRFPGDSELRLIDRRDRDLTLPMQEWVRRKVAAMAGWNLRGFIFKSKSPSCGLGTAKIFDPNGVLIAADGMGLFTALFLHTYPELPVADEVQLRDPAQREQFIRKILKE